MQCSKLTHLSPKILVWYLYNTFIHKLSISKTVKTKLPNFVLRVTTPFRILGTVETMLYLKSF